MLGHGLGPEFCDVVVGAAVVRLIHLAARGLVVVEDSRGRLGQGLAEELRAVIVCLLAEVLEGDL